MVLSNLGFTADAFLRPVRFPPRAQADVEGALRLLLYLFECDEAVKLFRAA